MVTIAGDSSEHDHKERYRLGRVDHILDGSGKITLGGSAQDVNQGEVRGYELHNPSATDDLWVADNGSTAGPNAAGSIRVPANGGTYWTPHWWPELRQRISIYGATTGQPYTLRYW